MRLDKEKIALNIFTAMLPRVIEKCNSMAFAEGGMKVFRMEIQGAFNLADIWIEERNKKELGHE